MLSKDNGSAAIARDKKKWSRKYERKKNRVGQSRKKILNREVLIRDGRVTGNKQFFFLGLIQS